MLQIDDIQVVLVLYKQEIRNSISFLSLNRICVDLDMNLDLYIYDNSPLKSSVIKDDDLGPNIKTEYVHDPGNSGVSRAYNQGAIHALEKGKKWLLFLDQDSELDSNIFNEFLKEQETHTDNFLFVPLLKSGEYYISPCKYFLNKGFATKNKSIGRQKNKYKSILNSGIFIHLPAFIKIGGYDENVPLYFSDFVFFKRYGKIYDSFVVLNSTIKHELSDMSDRSESNSVRTFQLFCEGARQASNGFIDYLKYSMIILARGIVLTTRYRKLVFLSVIVGKFFCRKKKILSEKNLLLN